MKSVVVMLVVLASLAAVGCTEEKSTAKPASSTNVAILTSAKPAPSAVTSAAPGGGW